MATDDVAPVTPGSAGFTSSVRAKFTAASLSLAAAVAGGGALLYVGGTATAEGIPAAAVAGGGLIAAALLAFVVLAWRTVGRLTDIAETATAVSRGDLDTEVTVDRSDELGQLSASLDQLRTELRQREDAASDDEPTMELPDELEDRAREFSEIAAQHADGDFTTRMDPDGDVEPMCEIARQFNRTMDEFEETVVDLQEFAQVVADASEDVNGSAQDVRESSQEVAASVREVVTTTEEGLDAVSSEMEELSTMTEQIASSSNQVAQLSRRTAETGREGREAAQSAIYGMNEIRDQSDAAVEEIERLREEMAQIDDLVDFITSVAERTNMLALNANIEASRGDGGGSDEGFGVVAEEIRELADDTKETAGEIEERLERIQAQTDSAANKVEDTRSEVATHAEAIESAIEALDEIAEYAEETNTGIQEINAATEQQAAAAQEIVAIVDDTQSTIDETAATARNVVEAAEDQASVLDDVADNTADLAKQARWLDDTLSMFRVSHSARERSRVGDITTDADLDVDVDVDSHPAPGQETAPDATSSAATESSDATSDRPVTADAATARTAVDETHFATGHGAGDDSRRVGAAAARQALDDLGVDRVDFCQVFVAPQYDYAEVVDGIHEVVGDDTVLIGSSTSGEFTDRAAEDDSVALSLVTSDTMDFHVGLGDGLSENVSETVEAAIAELPDEIDRPHLAAINLHDGLSGVGNKITLATQRKLGRQVSLAGGSAADNLQMDETAVFVADDAGLRVSTNGVAMGLIASEKPIPVSVEHGNEPISDVYTVTKAEGGTVYELDGRPAFEVWKEAVREHATETLGIDVDEVEPGTDEWVQMFGVFEFGVVSDRSERPIDHRVRWPGLTDTTEGPLDFAVEIPEGERLRVMISEAEKQVESAEAVASQVVDRLEGEPAGAFVYDCACRSLVLGDDFDRAVDAIDEELGDAPLVGLETYGEMCMMEGETSGFHNTTSVVMALPR